MKKVLLVLLALALVVGVAFAFTAKNITSNTTTTISARPCYLSHIVVNGGTMGTITVWDNNATTGAVVATISSPTAGQHYVYDAAMVYGLKVVTADNTNITVLWQ
jgi:hypothetical protein